mmetsp:Transcript_73059/g.207036  ORF Transcript_73059/g.207036 Transcript_73059/m.207036 type:complete len:298 (+) Transcript_73059:3-896(+)
MDMELPDGHRFPIDKYRRVRELLQTHKSTCVLRGPLATVDEACLVHDRAYVDSVTTGNMTESERRRVGFKEAPVRPYVLRSLASTGATVAATRYCLTNDGIWSGALSGGTHHAFTDRGEGFCVFNDIAVATRVAQKEFGIDSVLIVDLDVHQGNGTAHIFEHDDRVVTYSVHQAKGYPFSTRSPSDVDIDLPDGCDDEAYMQALNDLPALLDRCRPGILFYQAGVDGLAGDRFGRLALTREGLSLRNRFVYDLASRRGIPVVVTMGGGYHRDISKTIDCSADAYRQAVDTWLHREMG